MLVNSSAEGASEVGLLGGLEAMPPPNLFCHSGAWALGGGVSEHPLGWGAPLTGRKQETAKVFRECWWLEIGLSVRDTQDIK